MSLLTPDERRQLVPKGCYVHTKCDNVSCGKPIMSSLTYTGPNGEDFCSKACLNGRDYAKSAKEKKMSEETKKAKKAKPVEEENAKPKPSKNKEAVAPTKTKKVKPVEDDEDEAPVAKKKSKKVAAEPEAKKKKQAVVEDEPPAKKKVKKVADEDEPKAKKAKAESVEKNPSNPYARPGSIVYQIFEKALAGTTVKEINKMIEAAGVSPNRPWRELKSCNFRGRKWKYIEQDGKVSVRLRKAKAEDEE